MVDIPTVMVFPHYPLVTKRVDEESSISMPQPFIVEAVLDIIRREPRFPSLDIVDLSCGEGEILLALKGAGCSVRGSRYCSNEITLSKIIAWPTQLLKLLYQ